MKKESICISASSPAHLSEDEVIYILRSEFHHGDSVISPWFHLPVFIIHFFLFLRLAIWIKIQIMRNLSDDKFIEKYSRYYLTRGLANDHLVIYFSLMHHCGINTNLLIQCKLLTFFVENFNYFF